MSCSTDFQSFFILFNFFIYLLLLFTIQWSHANSISKCNTFPPFYLKRKRKTQVENLVVYYLMSRKFNCIQSSRTYLVVCSITACLHQQAKRVDQNHLLVHSLMSSSMAQTVWSEIRLLAAKRLLHTNT